MRASARFQRCLTSKADYSEPAVLPPGWTAALLSDVVDNLRPRLLPKDRPDLPFVGMDSVEAHSMRLLSTIPAAGMRSSAIHFQPGDVLYGRLRPYLNKVITARHEGLASAEFIPLTARAGIEADFVRCRLNSADFVAFTSHLDEGDRPRVDFKQIGAFPFWLPPSEEQRRIVEAIESCFTRLDDAVASLERVQRNLKRYRSSVLKAAVEGRLVPTEAELARAEGRDYEPASALLEHILEERRRRRKETGGRGKYVEPVAPGTSDLPQLPEGWCWSTVEQLTIGDRRSAYGVLVPGPHIPDGVGLIRVGDIGEDTVNLRDTKRIAKTIADKFPRTYLQGGELLLSLVGTIGRTAIAPNSAAGFNVARAVGVIPLSLLVDSRWVARWFQSPEQKLALSCQAHEVARKTLNLEDVRRAPIALPPRAEQVRIAEAVESILSSTEAVAEAVRADAHRCSRLRQSVLKWAFSGMLVDQDPTDEPALKLLERIRTQRQSASSSSRAKPTRGRTQKPRKS